MALTFKVTCEKAVARDGFWYRINKNDLGILLSKCAKLYCQVWKEPPWNEDFWQPAKVVEDLGRELAKPWCTAFMEVIPGNTNTPLYFNLYGSEIIAFTWGYRVDQDDMRRIAGHAELDYLFTSDSTLVYVDELAVDRFQRCNGIGRKITMMLLKTMKSKGATQAILRTDVKAVAARVLYAKLGFRELEIRDQTYPDRSYWIKQL